MSDQDVFIFELSQSSFNSSAILNSYKLPVVVEFMAVWSEPCIKLADNFSLKARELAGQFIFAKVDIDEQRELQKEYDIQNIPTVKVFKDGKVVRSEEGLLSDTDVTELLKSVGVFRASDELREQARQKHMAGDTIEAINLLTQAIQQDPGNTRIAMDMVQVFIDIGEIAQAEALFNKLPATDKESNTGQILTGQLTFKKLAANTDGMEVLQQRLQDNPGDHDAQFDLSVCYVAENQYTQAMDLLFAIFDSEPEYKEGAAREMIISLTNMLSDNEPELAQQFRRRLGSSVA